jgi:hypothetical protein
MILPSQQDRGIVVFVLLPSMAYGTRLITSFILIAVGFLVQVATGTFLPGCIPIIAGNLLLLVKGYDNRVDPGRFDPEVHWEPVELGKLQEIKDLDRKIRRWDRSALDASNALGLVVFALVAAPITWVIFQFPGAPRLVALDAAVLLVPHWITGIRSILVRPGLVVQIDAIESVLNAAQDRLSSHKVTLMMLLGGGETKIPEDIKFKVDLADHHDDFLGLYGQAVLNDVQGTSYPYFYVVLVARKGYGLGDAYRKYHPPKNITKEFKPEGEVEVMVIRQHTTETKGYHTKPADARAIFFAGLETAERVAVGVPV